MSYAIDNGAAQSDISNAQLVPGSRAALPEWKRGTRNQNPPGISLLALLREDLRTHRGRLHEQGFWAVAVHRLGNSRMSIRPRLARLPFSLLYRFLEKWVEWTCGISLPYTVKLGRRVRIWHHSGIILAARSIGNDVQIRQNTTLGVTRTLHNHESPVIEDGVDIGCGAVILGGIVVGRGAVIGANAVVLHDVPPGGVAVGVPARIIRIIPAVNNSSSDMRDASD
jgi:serine O-acetyltransferase